MTRPIGIETARGTFYEVGDTYHHKGEIERIERGAPGNVAILHLATGQEVIVLDVAEVVMAAPDPQGGNS